MNILYINNSLHLGGDTKCIFKLCKEIKNKNKVVVASSGGILLKDFLNLGIKHYKIKDPKIFNIFSIILNISKIKKIVRDENIQLIHSHHRLTTFISKIVSYSTGVKLVHTQHVCINDKFFLTRLALRNIDVISVSDGAKKILVKNARLDRSKITTIYNSVELENENKIVDSTLVDKKRRYFTIAQVGRLVQNKGIYDFVNIAKEVKKTNENIRFFLIGDGEEHGRLKSYIKKNNLEDYVYMLGNKDNVIEHLKYVDLVLLCSYIEGLPLAPIEAFSQRIPVIASSIPGTSEEIVNGINGYLVSAKDIEGFAKRINEVYEDKELYKSLKRGAYRTFIMNFTSEKYINSHLKFYKKIYKRD